MALFDRFRRKKTAPPAPAPATTAEQERLAQEAAERERREQAEHAEAERAEAERLAQEAAERERREQAERAEAERLAQEAAERAEAERLAQERRATEQAELERLERAAQELAEQGRLALEAAERERAEREQDEEERLAREQAEREQEAPPESPEPDPDEIPDEDPAVAAERAKVRRMLEEVGPELRQRRIVDLLGATFGRLAPPGEWGSATIEFRPAPEKVFLRVSVDGPDGGRSGTGSWNPAVSMVEMLIQELQRSMYVPGSGTWIDGRITFTHRGAREDKRGRALPPDADVAVNWSDPPTVGVDEHPYTAEEAQAFLARYPRDEVPEFLRSLTTETPPKRRRRWF